MPKILQDYLVYESSLLRLMRKCYVCGQIVELKTSTRGTLLVVQGSCPDGHKLCWESQPMVKGIASGNLALSAAILFCGLTYTKVANMAMLLNMPIFSESTFHRLQKDCCAHCICATTADSDRISEGKTITVVW